MKAEEEKVDWKVSIEEIQLEIFDDKQIFVS